MTGEPLSMPSRAVVVAIPVLAYTVFCFLCGIALISVLVASRQRASYVFLLAISTTLTAVVGIIQQSDNIINWHDGCIADYKASIRAHNNPTLALGPLSSGFGAGLWWTQFYLYNVDALLILFWAVALVLHVWNWQYSCLDTYAKWFEIASKISAFVFPAIMAGVRQVSQLNAGFVGTLILVNFILFFSFTLGSFCIMLILAKYLRSRLGNDSCASRSPPSAATLESSRNPWVRLRKQIDPWLVVRFGIAWFVMSGFEVVLVLFCLFRYDSVRNAIEGPSPDFSVASSIKGVINYLYGPTAALVVFLIFGTTAQHRVRYASAFKSLRCLSRDHPRALSPRIDRHSSQRWGRMPSQERSQDGQRSETVNCQLESADDGARSGLMHGVQPTVLQDLHALSLHNGSLYDPHYHQHRRPSTLEGCSRTSTAFQTETQTQPDPV